MERVKTDQAKTQNGSTNGEPQEGWNTQYDVIPSPDNKEKKVSRISTFEDYLSNITSILLKTVLLFIVAFLLFFLWREFNKDHFTIEIFQVPKSFEESGYTGYVVAQTIFDEVIDIRRRATTVKETVEFTNTANVDEMNLHIVGLGFSLKSLINQLKKSFGRPEKVISGELTHIDTTLSLTIRIPGFPPKQFENSTAKQSKAIAIKQLLKKASEQVLLRTEPYLLAVDQYYDQKDQDCIRTIRYIIDEYPEDRTWAYNLWGNIFRDHQNNNEAAIGKYLQAIAIDDQFPLAYTNLGNTYYDLKEYEKAEECLNQSHKLDDSNYTPLLHLSKVYLQSGEKEKASAYFEKALFVSNEAEKFRAYSFNGNLHHNLGEKENALQYYEKALEYQPYHYSLLNNCAILSAELELYPKAISYFQKLLDTHPESLDGLNGMAYLYLLQGKPDKSMVYLNQSLKIDSINGATYAILAGIQGFKGDKDGFFKNMDLALQDDFNIEDYHDNPIVLQYAKRPEFKALLKKYNRSWKD